MIQETAHRPRDGRRFRLAPMLGALLLAACPALSAFLASPARADDAALLGAEHGALTAVTRAGDRLIAVGVHGRVLLSDDNGRAWRLGESGTEALLDAVAFASDRTGYAAGQDKTILRTDDGGQTWRTQSAAPGGDQLLLSVLATSPTRVTVSGSYDFLTETEDGEHWTESRIADLDDDYHLNALARRGDALLLVGESGNTFLRVGQAWKPFKLPYEGSQFGCLVAADGTAYSFGLRGSLFRAPPGPALAWTRIDSATTQSLFGGAILPDGRIVLGGANGTLVVLAPDGGHARAIAAPSAGAISGVAVAANGDVVLAGDDGIHIVAPDALQPGAKS